MWSTRCISLSAAWMCLSPALGLTTGPWFALFPIVVSREKAFFTRNTDLPSIGGLRINLESIPSTAGGYPLTELTVDGVALQTREAATWFLCKRILRPHHKSLHWVTKLLLKTAILFGPAGLVFTTITFNTFGLVEISAVGEHTEARPTLLAAPGVFDVMTVITLDRFGDHIHPFHICITYPLMVAGGAGAGLRDRILCVKGDKRTRYPASEYPACRKAESHFCWMMMMMMVISSN